MPTSLAFFLVCFDDLMHWRCLSCNKNQVLEMCGRLNIAKKGTNESIVPSVTAHYYIFCVDD